MTAVAEDARISAFAGALAAAGADAPFLRDGLIYFLVPLWCVEAYARARYARADVLEAVLAAHLGADTVATERARPDWIGWRIGRAWVSRLGELERAVRGPREMAA